MGARKQINDTIERRFLRQSEIRVLSEGSRTIRGYGVVFNRESQTLNAGGRRFKEVVRPESAQGVDLSAVLSMHNHNSSRLLGNTRSGTMRVGVDEVGIWYEVDLPESPTGEDVLQSVARGDTQDSSFQFTLTDKGDKWEMRNGILYRDILQFAGIFEMGPVSEGAYPDTTVAQRNMERQARDILVTVEDTGSPADPEPQYILSYIIENSTWALSRANSMIESLNIQIQYYLDYAKDNTQNAAVFQSLADCCLAAKSALIQMIDGHADAIKTLNATETRVKPNASAVDTDDIETQIQIALLERQIEQIKFTN